ncbi:MAG: segregation/condensation protein A [Oscillospiraceae bacterium]|nr:segregation/condensation protein A [Oscillospiraceae bacterium]
MEALSFQLNEFEGPLDLLLYLISKNKMNIYDIEIVALINQYLAAVDAAEDASLESASEFIEMAAKLVQMKSFFLLPKSDEAERMRQELTGQLVEYSMCKAVAEKLRAMSEGVFIVVREPMEVELDETYRQTHDIFLLEQAYIGLMGRSARKRPPRQEQFEPIVQAPFVSVTSRIIHILRGLVTGKSHRLGEFFYKSGGRSQMVATFLAMLELVRAGRITIDVDEEISVAKRGRSRM